MAITQFIEENRFLSNFYPSAIIVDGMWFPTVEHAYQASKTTGNATATRAAIARLPTPGQAKRAGRVIVIRPDWEAVKLSVMEYCLRMKFSPMHEDLVDLLLATGDQELIEGNTWNDIYWGVCRGTGENHLGKLLMKIRSELQHGQ